MPLTEKVNFKTTLQKGNRVQIPKFIRWRFKLETDQILKVTVSVFGVWGVSQSFLSRMGKDGRILLPKLQIELMQRRREINLTGHVIEVTLEPT
jgi:bifunctional DNA-binding transcriptional regulator/antitoxin component of YhaV-PrlF toxin-antitoxin module